MIVKIGSRKMCFTVSWKLQLTFLPVQQARITFYTCPKNRATVWEASSTATCKLQLYPTAKGQLAKSLKHISQS